MNSMASGRETIFDSIKGIAIIGIFLVHNYVLGNIVSSHNMINILIQKGRYGVELTFMVNAFFFAWKYESRVRTKTVSGLQYVYGMVCKTIPLYWGSLCAVLLFEYCIRGKLIESPANILSHFLGVHAISYEYFNSLLPGSGYIGVLYLTWFFYLIYCKYIDSKEKSMVGLLAVFFVGYVLRIMFVWRCESNENFTAIYTMVDYYIRAFYSFAAGNMLYYASLEKRTIKRSYVNLMTIFLALIIIVLCCHDYIREEQFILLASLLVYVNLGNSSYIVDNKLFSTVGKYCFEIYLVHVLLYGILPNVVEPGYKQLFYMIVLTIALSLLLHRFVTRGVTPVLCGFLNTERKYVAKIFVLLLLLAIGLQINEKYEIFVVTAN